MIGASTYYPDTYYIVELMPYAPGEPLDIFADAEYPSGMPEKVVQGLIIRSLPGFVRLHAEGIVHRDINSSNLQLGCDGVLRIIDFGLAQRASAHQIKLGSTWTHLAPEAVRAHVEHQQPLSQPATPAADVFSFFVTMHKLAVGDSCHCKVECPVPDMPWADFHQAMNTMGDDVNWGSFKVSDWTHKLFCGGLALDPQDRWTFEQVVLYIGEDRIAEEMEECESDPLLYANLQFLLNYHRILKDLGWQLPSVQSTSPRTKASASKAASSASAECAAVMETSVAANNYSVSKPDGAAGITPAADENTSTAANDTAGLLDRDTATTDTFIQANHNISPALSHSNVTATTKTDGAVAAHQSASKPASNATVPATATVTGGSYNAIKSSNQPEATASAAVPATNNSPTAVNHAVSKADSSAGDSMAATHTDTPMAAADIASKLKALLAAQPPLQEVDSPGANDGAEQMAKLAQQITTLALKEQQRMAAH